MPVARLMNGTESIRSGALGNLFPPGTVGDPTDYALVEVVNDTVASWASPKAWLTVDTGGAAVALAIADGTARSEGYTYSGIDPSTLTYSTPTTQLTGLTLPTLTIGQKCLLGVRRVLTGALPVAAEVNVLRVA